MNITKTIGINSSSSSTNRDCLLIEGLIVLVAEAVIVLETRVVIYN